MEQLSKERHLSEILRSLLSRKYCMYTADNDLRR